jgi:soluble lytic murein transglycosylase-like protein
VVVGEHTFELATPTATPAPAVAAAVVGQAAAPSRLWPGFAPSVLYWEPLIVQWADHYGVDANQAAVIMQVESCGDPQAISSAGAQGLFQVMPFHFAAGENSLDPDTNAMRGLGYFAERLEQTAGNVGLAFAGYNGGHRAAGSSWDQWADETRRYYVWTTGILAEIEKGDATSETLGQWYRAGGASLCNQAAARLGLQG